MAGMIVIRSRHPSLGNALISTSVFAVVTIVSRLFFLQVVVEPWMRALLFVELVVVGNAVLLASIAAHRRSGRALRVLSALHLGVIVHASLWILAMIAFLAWERPDCAGSEGEGPFEIIAVTAIGIRTLWLLGKIVVALWGRATVRRAAARARDAVPAVF